MTDTNYVFIIDTEQRPQHPISHADAQTLLKHGKASWIRQEPSVCILKDTGPTPQRSYSLHIDPGYETTGMVIKNAETNAVIWAAHLQHRPGQITEAMITRSAVRRNRRTRKTRYRPARFSNRKRGEGWLPPTLKHLAETIVTWVKRIVKYVPISRICVEVAKFDTQKMLNPEISGIEYQRGTLHGWNVRAYVYARDEYKCMYCGLKIGEKSTEFNLDHVIARSRGGSNCPSNLVTSCEPCNKKKDDMLVEEFLKNKPKQLAIIKAIGQNSLKAAAGVQSSKSYLLAELKQICGDDIELYEGNGALTSYNRERFISEKKDRKRPFTNHWLDAACVDDKMDSTPTIAISGPKIILCKGRSRRLILPDSHGFAKGTCKVGIDPQKLRFNADGSKTNLGHRNRYPQSNPATGDLVEALVPEVSDRGKKLKTHGKYRGFVRAAREDKNIEMLDATGTPATFNKKYVTRMLQKFDRYEYRGILEK